MKPQFFWPGCLLVLLILSACQDEPSLTAIQKSIENVLAVQEKSTVIGKVTAAGIKIKAVEDETQGVPEARVLVEDTLQETLTDSQGNFRIENVPVGQHVLVAEKINSRGENFKLRRVINVQVGETLDVKSLLLKKTGVIFGLARLAGQTDHTGIDIFVSGSTLLAKSDKSGDFTMLDVPEGSYTVSASKVGYGLENTSVVVESGKASQIPELTLKMETQTQKQGRLQGSVRHQDTAIPNATISLSSGGTVKAISLTDEKGHYEIGNLGIGTYAIIAAANGFSSKRESVTLQQETPTDLNLLLEPDPTQVPGHISGHLLDKSGAPLAGATLATQPPTQSVQTDQEGRFHLSNLAVGSYTVVAERDNRKIASALATIPSGQTVEIQLQESSDSPGKAPVPLPVLEPDKALPDLKKTTANGEPATAVIVSDVTNILKVGSQATFRAVVTRKDNTTQTDLRWSSSDTGVAQVDSNGTVTAVSPGSAIITVSPANSPSQAVSIFVKVVEK